METGSFAALAPTSSSQHPLGSRVYATHWQLGRAVRANDLGLIEQALAELSIEYHDGGDLRVGTYCGDHIDRAAEDYLTGEEGQRIRRRHRNSSDDPSADFQSIPKTDLSVIESIVRETVDHIAMLDAGMADEVREYVREVRIVDSSAIGGMSSLRFFGTIFLSRPSPVLHEDAVRVHWFGGLVHETSHLHLHTLMIQDPLVINGQERFDSPLRRDKRPMLGIYHAAFVLARLALLFRCWHQARPECQPVTDAMNDALARLQRGIATIREHGQLTALGADLLDRMVHVA